MDVNGDLTFNLGADETSATLNTYLDLSNRFIGDTIYYPILVGSRDDYNMAGGVNLPDEVRVVVLEMTIVDSVADLDLDIYTAPNQNDGYKLATAFDGDEFIQTMDMTLFGGTDKEPVYNYYAVVSSNFSGMSDNAHIRGVAHSETSLVNIFNPEARLLNSALGQAYAHRSVDTDKAYVFFRVDSVDGANHRFYRLELRRNSDNADLRFVGAEHNLGYGVGEVSSGGDVVGELDWSNDVEGHYTVNLPGVTFVTDLRLITVEPDARIEIQLGDGSWTSPAVHETVKEDHRIGGAEKDVIRVRVTAPSGRQKYYDIQLNNGGENTDLLYVAVGRETPGGGWADREAKREGLTSYAATVSTIVDGESQDYILVPFRLIARSTRATVKLTDQPGQSYLAYEYGVGNDVNGWTVDNAIVKDKYGNVVGTVNNVSTVLDSANNTTSGINNKYTLTGELLVKKSVTSFYLDITVSAGLSSSKYQLHIINQQTDFSDLIVRINSTQMLPDSNGDFRYVKPVEDINTITTEPLYYMGKNIEYADGTTNGERDGLLYRLLPEDARYEELLANRAIYKEIIYDVSRTSVPIGATFANLEAKLNPTNDRFYLNIGKADQDNQSLGTFKYKGPSEFTVSTKVPGQEELVEISGNPKTEQLFTTNPAVNLFGAETRVPIIVTLNGEEKTFYAIVRKNALDQWLDFIRVDGKDLSLNRNPQTSMLEASTVVYNTTRSALVQIQSSETTAGIDMTRDRYKVYIRNEKGELVWENATQNDDGEWVNGVYNPAQPGGMLQSVNATGLLSWSVSSLNDGDNLFHITVTPVSGTYPPRDYLLIIHYVNLDVFLDNMIVFDAAKAEQEDYITDIDDMWSSDYYIPYTDRNFNSHIYDYRFNYELRPDGSGKLAVFADATTSYNLMKAYAEAYYPQYYHGEVYSEYYEQVLEALKAGQKLTSEGEKSGHYDGLSEAVLKAATVSILAGKTAELPPAILNSKAYNDTYKGILQNTNYHDVVDGDGNVTTKGAISIEAEKRTQKALADETIWVTIGDKEDITYKLLDGPNGSEIATLKSSDVLHSTWTKDAGGGYTFSVTYFDQYGLVQTQTSPSITIPVPSVDNLKALMNQMLVVQEGYEGHEKETKRFVDVDLEVKIKHFDNDGNLIESTYHNTDLDWSGFPVDTYPNGPVVYDEVAHETRIYFKNNPKPIVVPYDRWYDETLEDWVVNSQGLAPAEVFTRQDYMRIPVELYVPSTGFTLDYSATYHILSDDATLKPGTWGVDMGVQGYEPDEHEAGTKPGDPVYTYTYNLSHAVSQAYIWANINHDHDNTQASLALYRFVGGRYVLIDGNLTNLYELVDLDIGVNDFQIIVTAETGKENTYLIRINRAGANLALDYIRVNNMNAIYDPATASYYAYVPRYNGVEKNRPEVTAKAKDSREGVTTIWNTLNGSNRKEGAKGAEAELSAVNPLISETDLTNTLTDTPMQVMISMETVTTTRVPFDDSIPLMGETVVEALTDEDPSLITYDGEGNIQRNDNRGIITVTTMKREKSANGNFIVTTTKRTQYRIYDLTLIEVENDQIGVIVDSENGSFMPTDNDPANPRTAKWDVAETWYKPPKNYDEVMNVLSERLTEASGVDNAQREEDDLTPIVFGTYVVGVPAATEKVSIRVNTLLDNSDDLQQVKIGATPWRVADRISATGSAPTNNFTTEGMLDLVIPKDVAYMEVPIYVTYNHRNEGDPGILYMLHIYRRRADAYLVDLQAEEWFNGTDGKSNYVPSNPTFDQYSSRNLYDMTVEANVETIDFTDILPCDGATATVILPNGVEGKPTHKMFLPNELDAKADIHLPDGSVITVEKEDLVSVTTDDNGDTVVKYKDDDGNTQTVTIPAGSVTDPVTYRNELRKVNLEPGINRVTIEVTSEDGTVTRTYVVTIRRKTDPNAAKLRDIQMYQENQDVRDPITGQISKASFFYDFSPVYDPDNTLYYFAVPYMFEDEIVLNPVYYEELNVTYGVTATTYHQVDPTSPFQMQMAPTDVTNSTVIVPGLAPGNSFRVELLVYRRDKDLATVGGSTLYTLYFYKNDEDERDVTLTNDLTERVDYSPFSDIRMEGATLTRSAASSANASDHNFYYNTTLSSGELNINLYDRAVKEGYKVYWSDMSTYDSVLKEPVWHAVTDLKEPIKLGFNANDNWFVLKATDGTNIFYSSVTVYRDMGNSRETHLENLAVSDPTVPLFRDDRYEYFAAVDAETEEATIVVRGHDGDTYQTELRVRSVGGEYLEGDNLGTTYIEAKGIKLHQGSNRVTITVKHVGRDPEVEESKQTFKRVYEVELYLAGKTAYLTDGLDEHGDPIQYVSSSTTATDEASKRQERENQLDTGDIIWMDYTTGGHITPIWNSELVNYFLSYDVYSDDYETYVGDDGITRPKLEEKAGGGYQYNAEEGAYEYVGKGKGTHGVVYKLNDHLELAATLRPEEAERAQVYVQVTTIDPTTHVKTIQPQEELHRNAAGNWPYEIPELTAGETQVLFTVRVSGKTDRELDGAVVEDQITEKQYLITVYRNHADKYDMPNVAKHTAIQVRDAYNMNRTYGTIPEFDPEINFYYVNLPYEAESVRLFAQAGEYQRLLGNNKTTTAQYQLLINGRQVASSNFDTNTFNGFLAQDLMLGDNTVEINITVPDKATKYYTFILNRGDKETTEKDDVEWPVPTMTDLRINEVVDGEVAKDKTLIPNFDPDIHYYNVVVPYEVTEINAYGQAINSGELRIASMNVDDVRYEADVDAKLNATLEGWRPMPIPLKVGNENNIEFVAYGVNEAGKVTDTRVRYIVNVVRLPEGYVPPELNFMGVSEGTMTPTFHGRTYNYYVTVPYDVDVVDVEAIATENVSEVTLVNVDETTVGRSTYVTDKVTLSVGDNLVRAYIYDIRPVMDGGYPYYVGIYSLIIHRESKDGIEMELGDVTTGATTLKAISVKQTKSDGTVEAVDTNLPYAFNEYSNYVYVQQDAVSVTLSAQAAHPNAVVTINGKPLDNNGEVTVMLTAGIDTTTRVPVTTIVPIVVTDPATGTMKRYTLAVVRGQEAPSYATSDYNWGYNFIRGITVEGANTANVSTQTQPVTAEVNVEPAHNVTITMPSMYTKYELAEWIAANQGNDAADVNNDGVLDETDWGHTVEELKTVTYTGDAVTIRVTAPYVTGALTDKALATTLVRVNGHVATLVDNSTPTAAVFEVTLPINTYTDRFDIRVDVPMLDKNEPNKVERIENASYVLYITDEANAPKAIELDPTTKKPLRYTQDDLDAWLAVSGNEGKTMDDWTKATGHEIGDFKYSKEVLTGPQLDSIVLDENDGTMHSGTFTTKFYGEVFNYRATAAGDTFSVFAYVEHTTQNPDKTTTTTKAQYSDRPAYIEVYDEAGNRFTISKFSTDFVHFAFPKDENGKRDILNLTFRVIQYADSGYELVSE
ncbi:MAG: cadherin-like beta sandwich domain-containing protein, partial [Muribaculaceae bacterium]|nr:cadherin-like beta sandwich domain-containing protein [Muribaculaceae bacterium]